MRKKNKRMQYIIVIGALTAGTIAMIIARFLVLPRVLPEDMSDCKGLLATLVQLTVSLAVMGITALIYKIRRKTKWRNLFMTAGIACLLAFNICCPINAADTSGITASFGKVYELIAAIVSSVGQLFLLWGVFEWASALNSQDGTMQAMAFKRIAAGLVACLAPQLIPLIKP